MMGEGVGWLVIGDWVSDAGNVVNIGYVGICFLLHRWSERFIHPSILQEDGEDFEVEAIPDEVGCVRLVVRHWWFIHPNSLWEMRNKNAELFDDYPRGTQFYGSPLAYKLQISNVRIGHDDALFLQSHLDFLPKKVLPAIAAGNRRLQRLRGKRYEWWPHFSSCTRKQFLCFAGQAVWFGLMGSRRWVRTYLTPVG